MVKVLVEKEEYARQNVHKGMIGMLTDPEVRDTEYMVVFSSKYSIDDEDIYSDFCWRYTNCSRLKIY